MSHEDGVLKDYLREMRPWQWYKAIIVFAGPFFTGKILELNIPKLILTFLSFCFVASSIYVINDIKDAERDRLHPKKKNRPIASGRISRKNALLFATFLLLLSILFSSFVGIMVLGAVLFYFLLFILYTFYLKKLAVVDAFIIATGYLIRALAGCWATSIEITPWFYLVIFTFAVYLAFSKRFTEVKLAEKSHKESLEEYTKIVEMGIAISASSTFALYALYSMQKDSLVYTVPLALLGMMLHLRETAKGKEVHEILKVPEVALTFLGFLLLVFYLLYL